MSVYAYLVTKNEANRYLDVVLTNALDCADGVFVYDDQSDDQTHDILWRRKVPYRIRTAQVPSFLENEGLFREAAWSAMEDMFSPREGDWVLALDADEYARHNIPLQQICDEARSAGHDSLNLHIHETWTPSHDIRVDGFWSQIHGLRLGLWRPNLQFKPQPMGGGSFPAGYSSTGETDQIDIVHLGYAQDKDKKAKYERYSGRSGHASRHVESILQPATLAPLPDLGYYV